MFISYCIAIALAWILWAILTWFVILSKFEQEESRSEQRFAITKSILFDFQEALCYFIITVQFAVILAMSTGSRLWAATSSIQIYANMLLLASTTTASVLTLILVSALMSLVTMVSVYINFLSILAIVLAMASQLSGDGPSENTPPRIESSPRIPRLLRCGSYGPPSAYCTLKEWEVGHALDSLHQWSLIVLALGGASFLVFHIGYGVISLRRKIQTMTFRLGINYTKTKKEDKHAPLWAFLLLGFSALPFSIVAIYFMARVKALGIINDNHWGIGQIIAVAIWVPIVVRYVYWMICKYPPSRLVHRFDFANHRHTGGMKGHSKLHIAKPYSIVRDASPSQTLPTTSTVSSSTENDNKAPSIREDARGQIDENGDRNLNGEDNDLMPRAVSLRSTDGERPTLLRRTSGNSIRDMERLDV